ncbi:RNA polymerase II transcription mediator complex subunit 9-domain-containing protein [Achaetomium macrosporum]|uniref:Mediator of RNA polymerase II transcription subunit 9 n=1 Tax=Achaetomium macrosporum TaxID=79813 RepID=A0AAN7HIA0_9PEZI|nr:RNA polymerase II transcription mediator complex subunit 9-domain-containing protein [Achaetomium macrosporum]
MASHLPPGLSPDAVDALTELTSILTRLRSAQQQQQQQQNGTSSTAPGAGMPTSLSGGAQEAGATAATGGVTGTTPQPTSNPTPGPSNNNSGGGGGGGGNQPFTVKDLPPATDNLKHKLQRARAAMRSLADVQRSIALQEAEMAGLEARRRARAEMLAKTQEEGMAFFKAGGLGGDE